jgi:2-aminoethylphosphonate-pyruvate transaminase
VIHCESTTGIFNPIEEIGVEVARAGAVYIVDAMSSFGAIPVNLAAANADFLISSANKCIEGVPGFGFVLARRALPPQPRDAGQRHGGIGLRAIPGRGRSKLHHWT